SPPRPRRVTGHFSARERATWRRAATYIGRLPPNSSRRRPRLTPRMAAKDGIHLGRADGRIARGFGLGGEHSIEDVRCLACQGRQVDDEEERVKRARTAFVHDLESGPRQRQDLRRADRAERSLVKVERRRRDALDAVAAKSGRHLAEREIDAREPP